jgi:hypothetical protein
MEVSNHYLVFGAFKTFSGRLNYKHQVVVGKWEQEVHNKEDMNKDRQGGRNTLCVHCNTDIAYQIKMMN